MCVYRFLLEECISVTLKTAIGHASGDPQRKTPQASTSERACRTETSVSETLCAFILANGLAWNASTLVKPGSMRATKSWALFG